MDRAFTAFRGLVPGPRKTGRLVTISWKTGHVYVHQRRYMQKYINAIYVLGSAHKKFDVSIWLPNSYRSI